MRIVNAILLVLASATLLQAKLVVKVDEPKKVGGKSVVRLTITNSFKEKVESARAQVFLLDDKGKLVGQASQWVIGGAKDKPALAPGAFTTYNFVIPTERPFASTKVSFSRIVLEGGKVADPQRDFEMVR